MFDQPTAAVADDETSVPAAPAPAAAPDAARPTPLPLRSDTVLGVCEALGQDFGFNPNYLRVALAALILWNPYAILAIYLTLGAVVALSRWIAPPAPVRAEQPVDGRVALAEERLAA